MYKEIEGNLISLAKKGSFDVITHGCNCFSKMKSGIAPQMAEAFGCDKFPLELEDSNDQRINKLGQIDIVTKMISASTGAVMSVEEGALLYQKGETSIEDYPLHVINSYTQYNYGSTSNGEVYLDYEALTLCLRKINKHFRGKHIGLPRIGAGKAGGDWVKIKNIIKTELKNMNITIVNYKP